MSRTVAWPVFRNDPWQVEASSTRQSFGLPPRFEPLHIDDLAVTDRQHLEPLLATVGFGPGGGTDDLVVTDPDELRRNLGSSSPSLADLKCENLTGLVRAPSNGRVLPPEMTARNTTPLGVVREQRSKGSRVAFAEGLGGGAKLVDHKIEYVRAGYARLW